MPENNDVKKNNNTFKIKLRKILSDYHSIFLKRWKNSTYPSCCIFSSIFLQAVIEIKCTKTNTQSCGKKSTRRIGRIIQLANFLPESMFPTEPRKGRRPSNIRLSILGRFHIIKLVSLGNPCHFLNWGPNDSKRRSKTEHIIGFYCTSFLPACQV